MLLSLLKSLCVPVIIILAAAVIYRFVGNITLSMRLTQKQEELIREIIFYYKVITTVIKNFPIIVSVIWVGVNREWQKEKCREKEQEYEYI